MLEHAFFVLHAFIKELAFFFKYVFKLNKYIYIIKKSIKCVVFQSSFHTILLPIKFSVISNCVFFKSS